MCLDLLCCCFGPAACGLCCGSGKVKSSITTRLLYFVFLFVVLVVCSIMLSPTVGAALGKVTLLCTNVTVGPTVAGHSFSTNNLIPCKELIGYLAAYRVCMAMACFFLILTLTMICVRSSKDPRSYLQNGFWFFKWLFVIGLVVAFFVIPDGKHRTFSTASMAIGLIGSIFFIILQIVFLVDFAHSWAENWIGRAEETDNKCWYVLMLVFAIVFYVGSVIGIILLYVFFTEPQSCSLNKFFISSTLILGVLVSVVAVLPWIQRAQPKSGLLQASIVTAYCTYITWSAISTEPYGTNSVTGTLYNCQTHNSSLAIFGHSNGTSTAASVVGIALLFVTVAYMCFNLSGNRQLRKLRGKNESESDSEEEQTLVEKVYISNDSDDGDDDKEGKWRLRHGDDEQEAVTYSYSFFHFLMLLAVLYFMMQLTNWADPSNADTDHFQSTLASTWVKMVSSWLCCGVYLWTLLAPILLGRCRDFD